MNCKRIVALLLTVVILFSVFSVPAFASYVSPTYVYTDTSLDDLLVAASYFLGGIPFLGPSLQTLAFQVSPNNVCPISSDTRHSGPAVRLGESPGGGGRQCPVVCLCDYCGAEFTVYVQRSELAGAFSTGYDTYVDGLDSSTASASMAVTGYSCTLTAKLPGSSHYGLRPLWNAFDKSFFSLLHSLGINERVLVSGMSPSVFFGFFFDADGVLSTGIFTNPFGAAHASYFGCYDIADLSLVSSDYVNMGEGRYNYSARCFYSRAYAEAHATFLTSRTYAIDWDVCLAQGDFSDMSFYGYYKAASNSTFSSSNSYFFKIAVVDSPYSQCTLWPSGGISASSSLRIVSPSGTDATSRTGPIFQTINNYNNVDNSTNYYIGTVDTGGNVTNIYAPNIFDEQTLTFTEPVTGAQILCTGWKYAYRSGVRGYRLDLAEDSYSYEGTDIREIILLYLDDALYVIGSNAKLQDFETAAEYTSQAAFVDEYKYVIQTKVDPTTCTHTYTETTTTAPTCTAAGLMTYTCSKCGNTYTAPIPALGHDWRKVKTVDTAYNEDGSVADYSYTLYQCATCKEEYKDYDQTGPPSEDSNSGFFAWWKEAWTSFVSTLQGWFDDLKDAVSSSGSGGDTTVLEPDPGVDGSDGNKTDGFTFLDLLGGLVKGVWGICKGVVRLGGTTFSGFIEGLNGLPDGFGVLDPASSEGIFYVDTEGSDSW